MRFRSVKKSLQTIVPYRTRLVHSGECNTKFARVGGQLAKV